VGHKRTTQLINQFVRICLLSFLDAVLWASGQEKPAYWTHLGLADISLNIPAR